jgi:hypothetical protein
MGVKALVDLRRGLFEFRIGITPRVKIPHRLRPRLDDRAMKLTDVPGSCHPSLLIHYPIPGSTKSNSISSPLGDGGDNLLFGDYDASGLFDRDHKGHRIIHA